jgi:voltage-gated sodium channel
MLGWLIYHDHDPERFGTIGLALGTLFQVLTLEGWNDVLAAELEYTQWSWLYFVSFVLISAFVVLNVVIGIVVNSMDEARQIEHRRELQERLDSEHAGHAPDQWLPDRVQALRDALEDLESELERRGELPPP